MTYASNHHLYGMEYLCKGCASLKPTTEFSHTQLEKQNKRCKECSAKHQKLKKLRKPREHNGCQRWIPRPMERNISLHDFNNYSGRYNQKLRDQLQELKAENEKLKETEDKGVPPTPENDKVIIPVNPVDMKDEQVQNVAEMKEDSMMHPFEECDLLTILSHLDDFKTRNRVFAALLMYWGALNFVVYVRYKTVGDGFWAGSAFITGFGAFMAFCLLSLKELDESNIYIYLFKNATITILIIASILLFLSACYYIHNECEDDSCGAMWFGQTVIPWFVTTMIAIDLCSEHFQNPILRLFSFSGALMFTGLLCVARKEQIPVFGYALIIVCTLMIIVHYGPLRQSKHIGFNCFVTFFMLGAFILLLTSNLMATSVYIAWYLLAFMFLIMLICDLQKIKVKFPRVNGPEFEGEPIDDGKQGNVPKMVEMFDEKQKECDADAVVPDAVKPDAAKSDVVKSDAVKPVIKPVVV